MDGFALLILLTLVFWSGWFSYWIAIKEATPLV